MEIKLSLTKELNHIISLPGGWAIELLSSFHPKEMDFIEEDTYSMFESMSLNLIRGFSNHKSEKSKPFYLLDKDTGSRIRIYPPGTYNDSYKEEESWQSSVNPEPIL